MRYGFLYDIKLKGKVYRRTLSLLLALTVALSTLFFAAINALILRHQREMVCTSNLDLLELSSSSLDTTFNVLSHSMLQTLWNQDFITYMVNPGQESQELFYRISQTLRRGVDNNDLINRAYFYSPRRDVVFHNSNSILRKETMHDWPVLEECKAAPVLFSSDEDVNITRLLLKNGRLFLSQEVNTSSQLGTLVYELNLTELRRQLFSAVRTEKDILVLDRGGQPLFPSHAVSVPEGDWQDGSVFLTEENAHDRSGRMTSGWYLYENPVTGWRFLLPLDKSGLRFTWDQIFLGFIPALVLMLLLCIVFSVYVTRIWYYPINRLMQLAAPDSKEKPPAENETDYLEMTYSSALEEQNQLRGIVSNIAPEILNAMQLNVLKGKHLTQERVEEILHGIGDPIQVKSRYAVIVCQAAPKADTVIEDTEFNLYIMAVRNLTQQIPDIKCQVYVLHADVLTIALLCCAGEDQSAGAMHRDKQSIINALRRNAEAVPFHIFCASGSDCMDLLNTRHSYKEAMEKIHYQRYIFSTGNAADEPGGEEAPLAAPLPPAAVKARVKEIMDCAGQDEMDRAETLLQRLLEEAERVSEDDTQFHAVLQSIRDELLERVIVFPLSEEERALLLSYRMTSEQVSAMSRRELLECLREEGSDILRMSAEYGQKRRYKYIDQAKQYISENYMDSSLSLNTVGDRIGISSSYLSELWSSVTHEKFSSYLSEYRVEKAQQLLQTTKLSVKDIGFRCGFNSAQNFIRVYKKYTGMSPGQFREKQAPEAG